MLVDLHERALEDLTIEQVEAGYIGCQRDCTFFPSPAEVRERSGAPLPPSVELMALTSWNKIQALIAKFGATKTVRFLEGGPTGKALLAMGGLPGLMSQKDAGHAVRQWVSIYSTFAVEPAGEPIVLLGTNDLNKREMRIPIPDYTQPTVMVGGGS